MLGCGFSAVEKQLYQRNYRIWKDVYCKVDITEEQVGVPLMICWWVDLRHLIGHIFYLSKKWSTDKRRRLGCSQYGMEGMEGMSVVINSWQTDPIIFIISVVCSRANIFCWPSSVPSHETMQWQVIMRPNVSRFEEIFQFSMTMDQWLAVRCSAVAVRLYANQLQCSLVPVLVWILNTRTNSALIHTFSYCLFLL